jgi:hypothetical protein
MKNRDIDAAIRRILVQGRGRSSGTCPDANELAAWLEGTLEQTEMERFEAHASNCEVCAYALALSMTLTEPQPEPRVTETVESAKSSYRTSPLRFALGSVVLFFVVVILYQATRDPLSIAPEPGFTRQEAARAGTEGMNAAGDLAEKEPQVLKSPDASRKALAPEVTEVTASQRAEVQAAGPPVIQTAGARKDAAAAGPDFKSVQVPVQAEDLKPRTALTANQQVELKQAQTADPISNLQQAQMANQAGNLQQSQMANQMGNVQNVLQNADVMRAKAATSGIEEARPRTTIAKPPPAEGKASISGTIVDSSGKAVPGAQIVVKNSATGAESAVVSVKGGTFEISSLTPGSYEAAVTMPGFRRSVARDIEINAGTATVLQIPLLVTGPDDIVLVSGRPGGGINYVDGVPWSRQILEPRDQVLRAMLQARLLMAQAGAWEKSRKVGNRVFYRTESFWVDAECTRHDEAPGREISRDSEDYSEILDREPELTGIVTEGVPVLVFWNGMNLLIH